MLFSFLSPWLELAAALALAFALHFVLAFGLALAFCLAFASALQEAFKSKFATSVVEVLPSGQVATAKPSGPGFKDFEETTEAPTFLLATTSAAEELPPKSSHSAWPSAVDVGALDATADADSGAQGATADSDAAPQGENADVWSS